ncbi:MAG: VCBS repeat-containing protein, partial [Rhodopirellula sp.]|nr:VCBS repeat-containing protein [Rhodopirellula sp.]
MKILLVGVLIVAAGEGTRRWIHRELDPPIGAQTDSRLVESEGLILELTPRLKEHLNTSVLNLVLPDALGVELFADQVTVRDLVDTAPHEKKNLPGLRARKFLWDIDRNSVATPRDEVSLWRALFESVDYFERAGFKFVRSNFDENDRDLLHSEVAFEGLARDRAGRLILVKADQNLSWRAGTAAEKGSCAGNDSSIEQSNRERTANAAFPAASVAGTADRWRVVEWEQISFETIVAEQTFFAESLDRVIPDAQLRRQLRDSIHERHILDRYAALSKHEKWEGPHPYFSVVSQDRHPSLSVVDIDQDGLDDIYVMARWDRNLLLHNKGGYFEDVAPQYGLDIDSHCSSALFADFDNDGDDDLMLGRTLVPSQYFENLDGQFVDRTDTLIDGGLPALVTSVSAADYNGDGLLDVYFATYAANMQEDEIRERGPPKRNPDAPGLLSDFLPEATAVTLQKHLSVSSYKYHRHLNNYGPPNLLLINRGGRFETAPENEQVAIWRHTYQASWSDYDQDGDADLYLANDFAVNSLMRNDGDAGFVDVATETGTTDIGFGMGATWGDYDNDGRADLYV